MKSSVIVLLSFIIACNATLDYVDVAKKVLNKLLKYKDPLNGTFDMNFQNFELKYVINETKWYDWNRLELQESSVKGLQATRDTHHLDFTLYLPSPMIKGKVYYPDYDNKWHESEVTAIPPSGISIKTSSKINEYYSETVWTSVKLSDASFVSQFDCKLESMSKCIRYKYRMDNSEGPWNQKSRLEGQVKRLVYSIKYF